VKPSVFFTPIACLISALAMWLAIVTSAPSQDLPPEPPTVTGPIPDVVFVDDYYQGKTAREWHAVAARYRRQMLHRWAPTVTYALRLASAVSGVSYWQLRSVSHCESTHDPFAVNGRFKGLFQLGWSPFGFSPFDPVANALSAALTVRHDGSWRQWSCKP
jgi:hypothetical protein